MFWMMHKKLLEIKFNSSAEGYLKTAGYRDPLGQVPSCVPPDLTLSSSNSGNVWIHIFHACCYQDQAQKQAEHCMGLILCSLWHMTTYSKCGSREAV